MNIANKMGRDYADTVLAKIQETGFHGELMHRASEIESDEVRVGFFARISELAARQL